MEEGVEIEDLPKYEEVQHGRHQSFGQLFPRICWDESLENVKCRKGLFFHWDSLKNTASTSSKKKKNLYLLTEWEGRTDIWVEVMTYGPSAKYLPVWLKQQSIRISLYNR